MKAGRMKAGRMTIRFCFLVCLIAGFMGCNSSNAPTSSAHSQSLRYWNELTTTVRVLNDATRDGTAWPLSETDEKALRARSDWLNSAAVLGVDLRLSRVGQGLSQLCEQLAACSEESRTAYRELLDDYAPNFRDRVFQDRAKVRLPRSTFAKMDPKEFTELIKDNTDTAQAIRENKITLLVKGFSEDMRSLEHLFIGYSERLIDLRLAMTAEKQVEFQPVARLHFIDLSDLLTPETKSPRAHASGTSFDWRVFENTSKSIDMRFDSLAHHARALGLKTPDDK